MPILPDTEQPRKRRRWLVFLALTPALLLMLPICLLFSPDGCQVGKHHFAAAVTYQPQTNLGPKPLAGYSKLAVASASFGLGSKLYRANPARQMPVEVHMLGVGPFLLSLQWLNASNATAVWPFRRPR